MASNDDVRVLRTKRYELSLTLGELIHLRDLMSITVPTDGVMRTVSNLLANSEDRTHAEMLLWSRLAALVEEAGLPTEDAPDYVVVPTGPTPMGVYRAQSDEEVEDVRGRSGALRGFDEAAQGDTLQGRGAGRQEDPEG